MNVEINPPTIDLDKDLSEKEFELRSKRDGVKLHYQGLKKTQDKFQKVIIVLSLFTALLETVKTQLSLTESSNPVVSNSSAVAPIFLSTIVGIISSLLKFRDFPQKLENDSKAVEKATYAISRIRELRSSLNFEERVVIQNSYLDTALSTHREALELIEITLSPKDRQSLFQQAQNNLVKIGEDAQTFKDKLKKIKPFEAKVMITAKPVKVLEFTDKV